MNSYQTPDVGHEENWWEIVGLAYAQLYIGGVCLKPPSRGNDPDEEQLAVNIPDQIVF